MSEPKQNQNNSQNQNLNQTNTQNFSQNQYQNQQTINNSVQESSNKTILLILGGISIVIFFAFYFVFNAIWRPLKEYVSAESSVIEVYAADSIYTKQVLEKIKNHIKGKKDGDMIDTLWLSEKETNLIISQSPFIRDYKAKFRIYLQDSQFVFKSSMPVSAVKNHMASIIRVLNLKGYINGELTGQVDVQADKWRLKIFGSKMNNRDAPFFLLGKKGYIELGDFFANPFVYKDVKENIKGIVINKGQVGLYK